MTTFFLIIFGKMDVIFSPVLVFIFYIDSYSFNIIKSFININIIKKKIVDTCIVRVSM